VPYEHGRCLAANMSGAMQMYRFRHIERGMGMMFKAVGLPPRGRLSGVTAKLAWRFMQRRQRKLAGRLNRQPAAKRGFASLKRAA
jgi:hypothetical protein